MARVQVKGGLGPAPDGVARDLEIADGELFALAGTAESDGRSLLRRIAGLDASRFEIMLDEKSVGSVAPEQRNISLVFASGALFSHLSVRDNLAFGLKARGATSAQIEERLSEVSKAMLIEHLLKKSPEKLTEEEKVRVALARGLMRSPAVLLLDDPFCGLDSASRRTLRNDFLRAQRKLKVTTLLSTTDAVEAMAIANRVALFEKKSLRQEGSPLDLYDHPADRFVAARVGATPMNLLTLKVENGRVGIGGMSLGVPDAPEVVLGIRPEELFPDATSNATLPLRAVVDLCEIEGATARVGLMINDQRAVMVCAARQAPAEGAEVTVYTDIGRLRLFAANDTGAAIDFEVVDSARIVQALSKMMLDPKEIAALLEQREETPVITGVEITPTPSPHEQTLAVGERAEKTILVPEQEALRAAFASVEPRPVAGEKQAPASGEETMAPSASAGDLVTEQSHSSPTASAVQGVEASQETAAPDDSGEASTKPSTPAEPEAA